MKAIKRAIPLPIKHAIKRIIYRLFPGQRETLPLAADVYVISYPKCGRTWLRMMLARVLCKHLGLAEVDALHMGDLIVHPDLPVIKFTHDDQANLKTAPELNPSKRAYRRKKVIFLVRDVRDVVVSYYFELTKRSTVNPHYPPYEGDLSSFLRYPQGSLETIVRYYNIWAQNRDVPQDFLLVRYEDMHTRPHEELRRVLDFLGLSHVDDRLIADAIGFSSFENMRKMEASASLETFRLRPGDSSDPESFKTRRGIVGGYLDYFSAEDRQFADAIVARDLDPIFGYR